MTNADKIRAMSDEELAKFLCYFRSCDSSEHPCNGCKAEPYCMIGHNGMIDWLQQPVEDCETCHDGVCDIPGVIVQDEATEFTRVQWDWQRTRGPWRPSWRGGGRDWREGGEHE